MKRNLSLTAVLAAALCGTAYAQDVPQDPDPAETTQDGVPATEESTLLPPPVPAGSNAVPEPPVEAAEPPKPVPIAKSAGPANAELDALHASLTEDTRPVPERLQAVGYRHLYDTMTSRARPLLGLIKGYRMVLDVEKCNGPDEIRRLALRFINEVRGAQGVGAAYRITEQLCRPPT